MSNRIELSDGPIDPAGLFDAFTNALGGEGAVVSFTGHARETASDGTSVEALILESYRSVTLGSMEDLAADAVARFGIERVCVVHRTGRIGPGDAIVFVAAAAGHRRAAFDATDYLMDRLKTEAVFWKREETARGMRWIEPTAHDQLDARRWMTDAKGPSLSEPAPKTGPICFDEALARIAQRVAILGQETVPLAESAGRTLVRDLRARSDMPRTAVATRDGYAVMAGHTVPGATMRIVGESRAGKGFNGPVEPGEAVRIFTGARLPAGADSVVMQEYAERSGDTLRFARGYGPDRHVRAPASDFAKGDVLVPAGTRLGPRALVAAGAADVTDVAVATRPRVAILTTGDELAPPGEAHLTLDRIPETIGAGVAAMVESEGARVVLRQSEADDMDRLVELAGRALAEADLVVVIGGASVGERDFAKTMFAPHGLDTIFDAVAIKPGKPVWFGAVGSGLVLGLPGNPTSALVTAALFMRPILARLQGASGAHHWCRLPLATELPPTGARETFIRAYWDEAGLIPLTNQDSGAQAGLLRADRLIRCPPHQGAMAAGSSVATVNF